MKQPLYIQAATAISPQHTFSPDAFLRPLISSDSRKLYALDAPYAQFISPVAIRRMSRLLKMSISAAMSCLREAGLSTPDAILTGTGRGSVTDMELFLKDMIRLDEAALNPTSFIQSTYNSSNGWIAKQSACTGYNQTYVHRGASFELALQDAQMLMAEAEGPMRVLAGCFDELTEEYFIIRGKRGYWKKESISSATLMQHSGTTGTIGGEGAAFFVLANEPGNAAAMIQNLRIIPVATGEKIWQSVSQVLEDAGLRTADLSLVVAGLNGDKQQSKLYETTFSNLHDATPLATFKQLCGEYDTASGFGLWLTQHMISKAECYIETLLSGKKPESLTHVLVINHYILGGASVMLVSGCAGSH